MTPKITTSYTRSTSKCCMEDGEVEYDPDIFEGMIISNDRVPLSTSLTLTTVLLPD